MRDPPRKLDAELNQYDPDIQNVKIFFDHDRIRECTAYDADEGWVEFFVLDDKGKPLIDRGMIIKEKKHGLVQVFWIDPEKVHANPILYLGSTPIVGRSTDKIKGP